MVVVPRPPSNAPRKGRRQPALERASDGGMRDDMGKVITERPRAGGRGVPESPAYRRHLHWGRLREEGREDDSPAREGIRGVKWAGGSRHFTDVLGPVAGFLRKRVGTPWDAVWSELCAHLDRGSTTQRHVLEHVTRDFVVLHAREAKDGELLLPTGEPLASRRRQLRWGLFYVHPGTGELAWLPPRARPRVAPPRPTLDTRTPHHLLDGQWYELTFARLPADGSLAWDAAFRTHAGAPARAWARGAHWKDGGDVYVVRKRQLGRKEKRALGL